MALKLKTYNLSITLTGPLLGSQPGRDTPAADYLRDKLRKEHPELGEIPDEELEKLPEFTEELKKGTTGFHRNGDGKPMLYNYHIMGMLKAAASSLNGTRNFKNLRSKIQTTVRVTPRELVIDGELAEQPLERPLMGMTAQGPRVSLARSEMVNEGAKIECQIVVADTPKFCCDEALLRELLDYGSMFCGLGQWRNSAVYGQFSYELS